MSRVARVRPGAGSKGFAVTRVLHPSVLIRQKCTNKLQKERMEGLVLVIHQNRVVMWGRPATNAFIMTHPDFPNNQLYARRWFRSQRSSQKKAFSIVRTSRGSYGHYWNYHQQRSLNLFFCRTDQTGLETRRMNILPSYPSFCWSYCHCNQI